MRPFSIDCHYSPISGSIGKSFSPKRELKHGTLGIAIAIGIEIEIGFRRFIAQIEYQRPIAIATPIAIPIAMAFWLGLCCAV